MISTCKPFELHAYIDGQHNSGVPPKVALSQRRSSRSAYSDLRKSLHHEQFAESYLIYTK